MTYDRLLQELLSEGTLTSEQSLRVNEWLCSVEEERSGLTTASGPDSGIDNSSAEETGAMRRSRPSVKSQVGLFHAWKCARFSQSFGFKLLKNVAQGPEAAEESWRHEHDNEKEDSVVQLQVQIQRLESENTDFLAALEDAMEQYKQQVGWS